MNGSDRGIAVPPLDGSILPLVGLVDFQAEHNPSLPWIGFPSHQDPTKPTYLTFLELAKATHRVAHLVRPPGTGKDRRIVALLMHCDVILYIGYMVGLMRAGFIPAPIAPDNSPEAIFNLLHKLDCHHLISEPFLSHSTSAVSSLASAKDFPLEITHRVSLLTVFPGIASDDPNDTLDVAPYPTLSFTPRREDVMLYLHSSGSTGLPKPIPNTYRLCLEWCSAPAISFAIPSNAHFNSGTGTPYHTLGMFIQVIAPLATSRYVGLLAPTEHLGKLPQGLTPHNLLEITKVVGCDVVATVPAFVEAWSHEEEGMSILKAQKGVFFAGGPLSSTTGSKLVDAGVKLNSCYALTEIGQTTCVLDVDDSQGSDYDHPMVKTSRDWDWLKFDERWTHRWVRQEQEEEEGDGTYELQFLSSETHQPARENLDDVRGFATGDLFVPHPKKKNLWRIVGRKDDVFILSSGTNILPIPQETHIRSAPFISGAIMFGQNRLCPGLLVEPIPEFQDAVVDEEEDGAMDEFRDRIWPYVQEANQLTASIHAHIAKEMILVTNRKKGGMVRVGSKRTVKRKETLGLYEGEIDRLYERTEVKYREVYEP